jgi:hypothetical protein
VEWHAYALGRTTCYRCCTGDRALGAFKGLSSVAAMRHSAQSHRPYSIGPHTRHGSAAMGCRCVPQHKLLTVTDEASSLPRIRQTVSREIPSYCRGTAESQRSTTLNLISTTFRLVMYFVSLMKRHVMSGSCHRADALRT